MSGWVGELVGGSVVVCVYFRGGEREAVEGVNE